MSTVASVLKEGKLGLKGELTTRTREIIGHAIDTLATQLAVLDEPGKEKDNFSMRPLIDLKQNFEDFKCKEDKLTIKHFPSSTSKNYRSLTGNGDNISYTQNDMGKIQTVISANLAVECYSKKGCLPDRN